MGQKMSEISVIPCQDFNPDFWAFSYYNMSFHTFLLVSDLKSGRIEHLILRWKYPSSMMAAWATFTVFNVFNN